MIRDDNRVQDQAMESERRVVDQPVASQSVVQWRWNIGFVAACSYCGPFRTEPDECPTGESSF